MSTSRRAYNMVRAYVSREWDRLNGQEAADAWNELEQSAGTVAAPTRAPTIPVPTPPLTEEQKAAAKELYEMEQERLARSVLGVNATDGFEAIHQAYEKVIRRADPARFPAGSDEAKMATEIQSRVERAYRILSKKFSGIERRFQSLDLD